MEALQSGVIEVECGVVSVQQKFAINKKKNFMFE